MTSWAYRMASVPSPPNQLLLVAVQGDIAAEETDVIVNAANSSLMGGGGVDGAIHRAAGAAQLHAACAALGGCETGEVKLTEGFALKARWIAHAVGPVWRGGDRGEADLLASCYRRSLELADEVGAESIAFPAISTGIYGYPPEAAARIAVGTLRATPTNVKLARLVAFDAATLSLYEQLLA
jgi:O-acetyl-ADP-ribose deacetylase